MTCASIILAAYVAALLTITWCAVWRIEANTEEIMATQLEFDAALGALDAATNDIAADIAALKAQIAGGGLTAEQEADVLAKLDAAAAKLTGLAADPANPVP